MLAASLDDYGNQPRVRGRSGHRPDEGATADVCRSVRHGIPGQTRQAVHFLLNVSGVLQVLSREPHLVHSHARGGTETQHRNGEQGNGDEHLDERHSAAILSGVIADSETAHSSGHLRTLPSDVMRTVSTLSADEKMRSASPDSHAPTVDARPRGSKHSKPRLLSISSPPPSTLLTYVTRPRSPRPLVSTSIQNLAFSGSMWSCDTRPYRSAVERARPCAITN